MKALTRSAPCARGFGEAIADVVGDGRIKDSLDPIKFREIFL